PPVLLRGHGAGRHRHGAERWSPDGAGTGHRGGAAVRLAAASQNFRRLEGGLGLRAPGEAGHSVESAVVAHFGELAPLEHDLLVFVEEGPREAELAVAHVHVARPYPPAAAGLLAQGGTDVGVHGVEALDM